MQGVVQGLFRAFDKGLETPEHKAREIIDASTCSTHCSQFDLQRDEMAVFLAMANYGTIYGHFDMSDKTGIVRGGKVAVRVMSEFWTVCRSLSTAC